LKKNFDSVVSNLNDIGSIFNFELSPVMNQYEKIYKKLQNVFADLGGLFKALIMIGNIIVAQFNKKRFDYDLIYKTFYIDNEDLCKTNSFNKNIILNEIKNNGDNLIIENISVKVDNNQNTPKVEANHNNKKLKSKHEAINSIKNNVKSNYQLNKEFTILAQNNFNISLTNVDKNSINFIKEDNCYTRRIDDSTTRLNAELEKFNIKKEKSSYANQNEKNISPSNTNEKNEILKKRIESFLENRKKNMNKKKFVKLSKFEFFMQLFFCNKFKNQSLIHKELLISRAEDKIAEYLDVCSYTNLIEIIQKMKLIFLNSHQKLSIDYLKNRNPSDLFEENHDDKLLETILYYKRKIIDSNLNEQDQKLFENFIKEFKELIID